MKCCSNCGRGIETPDGKNRCPGGCYYGKHKMTKEEAKLQLAAINRAMTNLGLTRVVGACGGIYWE